MRKAIWIAVGLIVLGIAFLLLFAFLGLVMGPGFDP
jgi:hypothetical protein